MRYDERVLQVYLPREVYEVFCRLAAEKGLKKGTLARMIIYEYLKPYLKPQPGSGPEGPGAPAESGLGVAGPEGGDEPQREKEGRGEGG